LLAQLTAENDDSFVNEYDRLQNYEAVTRDRTDRFFASGQTDRHATHNTSHPYLWRIND